MGMLRLYNSLLKELEPFHIDDENKRVRLYVCGPTVYDDAHLGHARCYITWDVLYRLLTLSGYDVTYVRNVTDVDDKILKKAAEQHSSPEAIAQKYYERFAADMTALNVLEPTYEPRATAHIDTMITAIQALIADGFAYVSAADGTVYYSIEANQARGLGYGKLSGRDVDDLIAGSRVAVDPGKRNPLDFALWKPEPDPHTLSWESPWGRGRPGWHIECSAMNRDMLGDCIDIHAGGLDLIFPHHENEIAQSEAWTGCAPFARYWLHNGFVNVSGEKMSKSLGNFATVQGVLANYSANAMRYFLLSHHYRSPVDFTDEALTGARHRMEKLRLRIGEVGEATGYGKDSTLLAAVDHWDAPLGPNGEQAPAHDHPLVQKFMAALNDDMNTPVALAVLNEAYDGLNPKASQPEDMFVFLWMFRALGFRAHVSIPRAVAEGWATQYGGLSGDISGKSQDELIQAAIDARLAARREKNWALSDEIRDTLASYGIKINDVRTPEGDLSCVWG